MIGSMIHPLNSVLSSSGIYEAIFEMSHIVQLNSFWGAMWPQDLLFKAQDGVLDNDMRHRLCLQPSSVCFHHCQHTVLVLVDLWQCDVINLPGFPILIF